MPTRYRNLFDRRKAECLPVLRGNAEMSAKGGPGSRCRPCCNVSKPSLRGHIQGNGRCTVGARRGVVRESVSVTRGDPRKGNGGSKCKLMYTVKPIIICGNRRRRNEKRRSGRRGPRAVIWVVVPQERTSTKGRASRRAAQNLGMWRATAENLNGLTA